MSLRIITGIKWVPNTTSVNIDEKTGALIREGIPAIVNPHDLAAVEFALRLKDRYGGELITISMAPPGAIKGLEHTIGMGVDKAYLLSDKVFAGADTLATSYTLAKAIEKIGKFDLIIMGHETIDSSTAHIGAQVASWLNVPYIYYVIELEYFEEKREIKIKRILEDRYEIYKLKLPALISVAMHYFYPRDLKLSNKLKAKVKGVIEVWSNKELGLDPNCVGLKGSPTAVSKIDFVPKIPRKKEICKEKDPEKCAEWLINKLKEEGLI